VAVKTQKTVSNRLQILGLQNGDDVLNDGELLPTKGYFYSHDDPLGSYTGTPQQGFDAPEQDADDL
jgi:hypothetical protein